MTDMPQETISIEEVFRYLPDRPVKTTRGRGWSGLTLDYHAPAAQYAAALPARDHHLICYCAQGRGRLVQRRGGAVHEGVISAGMSLIMPAGYESVFEGQAAASARLRMPTALVTQCAEEIGPRGQACVEIMNVFSICDPVIEHFSKLLLAEIDRSAHPTQALIVESLSCGLAAHLLRQYNSCNQTVPDRAVGLRPQVLDQIIGYIEDNIAESISLAELAAIAQVSRFHFARMFRLSTGLSPIAFVERARLARARQHLRHGQLPIAEIALAVGFSDQSEFTRRFHRHVGTTPGAFAREHGLRKPPRRAR